LDPKLSGYWNRGVIGQELLMKPYIVLGVIFLMMVLPARGDLYTWTDADGVKHFSNEPPPVKEGVEQQSEIKHSAEQYHRWAEQRRTDQGEMLEDNRSGEEAKENAASTGKSAAGRHGSVVMYATKKCGYCAKARAFFKKHAVSYTEYDITTDKQAHARYKELNGHGVPLIFIGNKRISGFNEGVLKKLLLK
jgi:glutaredoxin